MTDPIKLKVYPESLFGGITFYDGVLPYYGRIQSLVDTKSIVLDYGCGRGAHNSEVEPFYQKLCSFRGKVERVIGVDPTDAGLQNTDIDEFKQMKDFKIPLPDESVDLCHSDWVVEHVLEIDLFFNEVHRVLKTGGYFCFRAPNKFHYSSLGASLLPFSAHYRLRQFLGHFHDEEDVFPTTYPCNTKSKAEKIFMKHGFESLVYYHRGLSHLMGMGYWPGMFGKILEKVTLYRYAMKSTPLEKS